MQSSEGADPELQAMASVLDSLKGLDNESQTRVLAWVTGKLQLSGVPVGSPIHASADRRSAESTMAGAKPFEGTVNTVAAKLGADSCRTLLVAAAAYLSISLQKERFSREEWVNAAKDARMWKSDYAGQVSINTKRLLEVGDMIEKSKDVYSLSVAKLAELEGQLVQ